MDRFFLVYTFVLLLTVGNNAFGQQPMLVEAWARTFGTDLPNEDYASSMAVAPNGDVVVTGTSQNADQKRRWTTLKYSRSGELLWERQIIVAPYLDDIGRKVAVGRDGSVYAIADVRIDYGMYLETCNVGVVKFDSNGVEQWRHEIGEGNGLNENVSAMAIDSTGNLLVIGVTIVSSGDLDIILTRFDQSGNVLWSTAYSEFDGGDVVRQIALSADGTCFAVGYSSRFDSASDALIIAFDAAGNKLWSETYNSPANDADAFVDVALDADGNVVAIGEARHYQFSNTDVMIFKYSQNGSRIWSTLIPGPGGGNIIRPQTLAVNSHREIIVAGLLPISGSSVWDSFVRKYSPNGTLAWSYTNSHLGQTGNGSLSDIDIDGYDNVYLARGMAPRSSPSPCGGLILKLDTMGELVWEKLYYQDLEHAYDSYLIDVDRYGRIVTAGLVSRFNGFDWHYDFLTLKLYQLLCGDVDGSGEVAIADAVFLVNYIFSGGPHPDPDSQADPDCTRVVNISDVVYLVNAIFQGGPGPCTSCQ